MSKQESLEVETQIGVALISKATPQFSVATNEYIGQGKQKVDYQCKGKVSQAARRRQRLG